MATTLSTKKPLHTAKKTFHVGCIVPLTEKNKASTFLKAAEALCEIGFSVSVLAEGSIEAQRTCFELLQSYPQNFRVLESSPSNRKILIESVDALIFPHEMSQADKKFIILNTLVPITVHQKGFEEYNAQQEAGNAFLCTSDNVWQLVAATIRAAENRKFAYDWKNLRRNIANTKI